MERRAGHASVPVAGCVHADPAAVQRDLDHRRPRRRERRPQDALERGVALDPHAARPARPRGRREVHRSEVRAGGRRAPVAILVGADHPVALVVEDDRHHVGTLAHGGLDLGHRHAHAAVADERHDAPLAVHERRREGGRKAVAHGARGGTEERAGPPEPEPARQPAGERPGVRRDDRVLGQQPVQVRDDPAGMDAGAAPVAAVDDSGLLPGRAVGGVVPVARGDGLGEEHALLEARVRPPAGRPARRPGPPARARTRSRRARTGARGPRASSAGPSPGPGTRRWSARSAGTRAPAARPRSRCARGRSAGCRSRSCPGTADGRWG